MYKFPRIFAVANRARSELTRNWCVSMESEVYVSFGSIGQPNTPA